MSSNLSFSNSTSERYALALYELSKEESELDKTENVAKNLKELFASSNDLNNAVMNPTIGKHEQTKIMEKISEHLDFSETFKKFIGLLIFKGRLFFLKKIIDSFIKLISKNKGELIVQLLSSKKLAEEEIVLIQKNLEEFLGKKLKLNYIYKPELIGGFTIQVGSIMIDSSLKSKLKSLEKLMIET